MLDRSAIASWRPAKRRLRHLRTIKPWGLVVHTSGRGIVERARKQDRDPATVALEYYGKTGGVHYVIGYDGCVYQLLADSVRGAHVGISARERRAYLNGSWCQQVPDFALELWMAKWWPRHKSPQHIYPTRSPNACYLGVELLPLAQGGRGLWFTGAQHEAVSLLWRDIRMRHDLPDQLERLVGHEDLDAFARWDSRGGWDPGALRGEPRFDWGRIR